MIKIHKEVYGQGKAIVLIHGWAMHTGIWRKFAQQLAQNYQVTCLDLPGHGLSETIEPYTLDSISDALIDVMPEQPCCVLGWSLGATVAMALTEKYPQRVHSLILLAGNPRFVQETDWAGVNPKMLSEFADNLQLNCQLTLIRFLALQVNNLPDGKSLLKELKQAIQECNPPSEAVLKSALDILKQSDLRESLISLVCPVHVIQGDKDSLISVQVSQDMKGIKPELKVNIINNAGHVPFLSHQSQVIEIINKVYV
ncbi:MAG: pimeloyl-ACP methyl ester esterase BioH [Methylococcaceae bacterium]|nr:pimeloyl-ACP methyl ester esterase BioH [Methylococcaceae bacterium]